MRNAKLNVMEKLQSLAGGNSGCQARKMWIFLWHEWGFSVLYCAACVRFMCVLHDMVRVKNMDGIGLRTRRYINE